MGKVMIVEDEISVVIQLEDFLAGAGYTVVGTAQSGEEALAMARDLGPDLALMDIVLPGGMDGIDTAQRLKEELGIPVAFVSGYGNEAFIRRARPLNPLGYVLKPFHEEQILTTVRLAFEEIAAREDQRGREDRYRSILDGMLEGYYEVDLTGRFVFINSSFAKIFGRSELAFLGKSYRDIADLETAKGIYRAFNEVYRTGVSRKGFAWEMVLQDGTRRDVEVSISLIGDREGTPTGFRGIMRDITDKKRLEAYAQQAQKMEAVATLAGGIAHEFNNALTSITGYTDLLQIKYPWDEQIAGYVEPMRQSALRMARLTRQLLAYARGGKYFSRILRLNDFVKETLSLLKISLNPDVHLETELPDDIFSVRADPVQMQMVLSALLSNANEAMEGAGEIRIRLGNIVLDEAAIRYLPGLKPGGYVYLTIEDTGKGMDERTRNRIFEPFFSTKAPGRGMDMSAVYGIVKNHDGWIIVDSEPGSGTRVKIYLPGLGRPEKEAVLDKS